VLLLLLLLLLPLGGGKGPMENPAKHLVYRPTTMQLLSILTTTVEIMPKVNMTHHHAVPCCETCCETRCAVHFQCSLVLYGSLCQERLLAA